MDSALARVFFLESPPRSLSSSSEGSTTRDAFNGGAPASSSSTSLSTERLGELGADVAMESWVFAPRVVTREDRYVRHIYSP